MQQNILFVVQGHDHPALFKTSVILKDCSWIARTPPDNHGLSARLRYRQKDIACHLSLREDQSVHLQFDQAQWAVTPGQFGVLYRDEVCLGGGILSSD
jgi:tRNA-specific 2-thiouridylase